MWNFNGSKENEDTLKPLCLRVDGFFDLPPRRIYRYFATFNDSGLTHQSPDLRGLHQSFDREEVNRLPAYLRDCFYLSDEERGRLPLDRPFEKLVAFDDLIYITPQVCLDPISCVITYAHELQHLLQNHCHPDSMKDSKVLRANLGKWDSEATDIDIPSEVDATIVSKRVAEAMYGTEEVGKFAKHQLFLIRTGNIGKSQRKKWQFFLKVSSNTEYDFVAETKGMIARYCDH